MKPIYILKSHIRSHARVSASGKVSQVKEHEDKRTKRFVIPEWAIKYKNKLNNALKHDYESIDFPEYNSLSKENRLDLIERGWSFDVDRMGNPRIKASRQAKIDNLREKVMNKKVKPRIEDTPEFKRWFGNSKVVDKSGKPLVVYHSTKKAFTVFKKKGLSSGFFFSESSNVNMTPRLWDEKEPYQYGSNIVPVYLSIKNPLILDSESSDPLIENVDIKNAKRKGCDGIYYEGGTWVAFYPRQIKSATGNQGTFDPKDPDITKSHVQGHKRTLKSGRVILIHDYENTRQKLSHIKPGHPVRFSTRAINPKNPEELTYYVTERRGNKIKIGYKYDPEDKPYGVAMPISSLKHFENDLQAIVKVPGRINVPAIKSVVDGKAEFLGKGDDGLAFKVGSQVVKVSSTVPYQPMNVNRSISRSIEMLRRQTETARKMRKDGIPGIPDVKFYKFGDKGFQVKPYYELPEKLTLDQCKQIENIILKMHKNKWVMGDTIQYGVDSSGKIWLYDTGKAHKIDYRDKHYKYYKDKKTSDQWHPFYDDLEEVDKIFKKHGFKTKRTEEKEESYNKFLDELESMKVRGKK